jgi:hypothetical protein
MKTLKIIRVNTYVRRSMLAFAVLSTAPRMDWRKMAMRIWRA